MAKPLSEEKRRSLNHFLASVERRAFAMANMAVTNPDDALEIVQDSMLKLTQLYSHKSEDEWAPLFHRILQNHIRDWFRRNKVKNRLFGWFGGWLQRESDYINPVEQSAAPDHTSPHREVQSQLGNQKLAKALKTLSIRQQQAFILRAWEGMDVKETAFAMDCSEGSVKTHYSRAIHTLRALLQDWVPGVESP